MGGLGLGLGISLSGAGGGAPTPQTILGGTLQEWWAGSFGVATGTNNTWTGKFGLVLTAAGALRPTLTPGNNGYWTFDGGNTGFSCAAFPSRAQPWEYFIGFMPLSAAPASQGFLVDLGTSTDNCQVFQSGGSTTFRTTHDATGVAPTTSAYSYIECQWNGSSTILGLNGVQNGAQTSAEAGPGGLSVGVAASANVNHFNGRIYEIVMCNAILSAAQRTAMNAYMTTPH